jgi:hypothetical protein
LTIEHLIEEIHERNHDKTIADTL